MTGMHAPLQKFQRVLKFDDEDLIMNRAGMLSEKQQKQSRRAADCWRSIFRAFNVVNTAFALLTGIPLLYIGIRNDDMLLLVIGLGIIGFSVGVAAFMEMLMSAGKRMKPRPESKYRLTIAQPSAKEAAADVVRVVRLSGVVHVVQHFATRFVFIATERDAIPLHPAVSKLIVHGKPYAFYMVAHNRQIVAVEPLDDVN